MHDQALPEIDVDLTVPFYDVDIMGMTWHGHYIKYFELARCALLDKIGYNYEAMKESGYKWPVIDLRVKYINPSHFNMKINVKATCVEFENRLKIEYLITDPANNQKLIKGHTTQVAVGAESGEMLLRSPDILFEKLGIEPS